MIEVLEPGLFTTVQDLGREGYGAIGVSASGAADALSLRVGNLLVGNKEGAAALEMTLVGGRFAFTGDAAVVLVGSDFGATLDGAALSLWDPVAVTSGQTLRVSATRDGARCYLCVRGGISVQPLFGSASTHILSGLGGYEGRALKKGDRLMTGNLGRSSVTRKLSALAGKALATRQTLRVTPGPQREWFDVAARELFEGGVYQVTEDANRMGLRLAGPAIKQKGGTEASSREVFPQGLKPTGSRGSSVAAEAATHKASSGEADSGEGVTRGSASDRGTGYKGGGDGGGGDGGAERRELVSEGVALGAVQIPESGQPIILFVEQQTAGGHPKIANVISADFHSLGQLRPRDEIRFEMVDWETARRAFMEQEELLASDERLLV